jgi:hypothetical protein
VEHNSWEYSENVENAQQKVVNFHLKNPAAPRRIRAVTFGTIPFRSISVTSASSRCFSKGGVIVRGTPFRYSSDTLPTHFRTSDKLPPDFRHVAR